MISRRRPPQRRSAIAVPRRDVDSIKAIRRLLKYAGRYLGLRALDVREEPDAAMGDINTVTAETGRPTRASPASRRSTTKSPSDVSNGTAL